MLFTMIILFCSAVLLGCVYATICASSKPNGSVLVGVTLSYTGLHDSRTKAIVRMYRQNGRRLILLCILLHIPICMILDWYTSVFIACYTLWCTILLAGANTLYQRSFRELYRLKSENHWFTGNSLRYTAIDTKLSEQRDKMPPPAWLFLPALVICFIPVAVSGNMELFLAEDACGTLFYCSLAITVLFILLYYKTARQKNAVFSEDSSKNITYNQMLKHSWSWCWLFVANTSSISFAIWEYGQFKHPYNVFTPIVSFLLIQTTDALVILYTLHHIDNRKTQILGDAVSLDFADDDSHWLRGYYYNPDSTKLTAPPRPNSFQSNIGMNMALPAARAITYTLYAIFAGLMLFLIISFARMDFAPFQLSVENENVVISAPFYGIEFAVNDIESMKLCDSLPEGHFFKSNGAQTEQYLLGNFKSGAADYKMYYYIGYSPFIQLQLRGYTIIFNTKDSARTMKLYNNLKKEL